MATKLADLTVGADGSWSSGPHTLAAGAHSVTLRRKSDGAVLVTRGFTVAAASGIVRTENFSDHATASAYSGTTQYSAGSYVSASGIVYRCIATPPSTGYAVTNPTYWVKHMPSSWSAAPSVPAWITTSATGKTASSMNLAQWSADTFAADQYAQGRVVSRGVNLSSSCSSVAVRIGAASDSHTGYVLIADSYDDGDATNYPRYSIRRVVNGVNTDIWASSDGQVGSLTGYMRLEVRGVGATVTFTVKGKAAAGDAWTTIASDITDSSANRITAAGHPGFGGESDDWEGGDL